MTGLGRLLLAQPAVVGGGLDGGGGGRDPSGKIAVALGSTHGRARDSVRSGPPSRPGAGVAPSSRDTPAVSRKVGPPGDVLDLELPRPGAVGPSADPVESG